MNTSNYKESLIIDARSTAGFFANFLMFVDNVKYCQQNNIKPIITMQNNYFYNDGRNDLWNSFFEPYNDNIIVGSHTNSQFFKLWDEDFLVRQGKVMVWENFGNNEVSKKNRLEVNEIVKTFKPIQEIESVVDQFVNDNFLNKKVVGVHIRGTDYGFNNLEKYVEHIKNYGDYDKIYVASDNEESIKYIESNLNNVCYYNTDIRKKTINEDVLCRGLSRDKKIKHGQDVLIECLLLSNCHHLVCINSNVAASALYINPYMSYDLIHRSEVGG